MIKLFLLGFLAFETAHAAEIRIGGKCLDVPSGQMVNGAKIQLYECNGTKAQQFEIKESVVVTPPPPVVTPPPPSGTCNFPAWIAGKDYKKGDKVTFKGKGYITVEPNPGYDPIISNWFWDETPCDGSTVTPPPPTTNNPPPVIVKPDPNPTKEIGVYLESWACAWQANAVQHCIANIPAYINTIFLSFVRPDLQYTKGSLAGTGMDFSADFKVVRDAIRLAQGKGQNVILSIGGATYHSWENINVEGIKALAADLNVSGLDIDWEGDQTCAWGSGGTSCPKDQEIISIIRRLRAAMPRPSLLTAAVWSTGALTDPSKVKPNLIGGNFGSWVNPLRAAGSDLDKIMVMSYDCGGPNAPLGNPTGCDPKVLTEAYKALYKGVVIPGQEGGVHAWGNHINTPAETSDLAKTYGRVFFWAWHKGGTRELITAACKALGKSGCDQAMPIVRSGDRMRTIKPMIHMQSEGS